MTNEQKQQINLYIAEKLFGWKWYQMYFDHRILLGEPPLGWVKRFDLKETSDMSLPIWDAQFSDVVDMPNCLESFNDIAEARTKIAERGLQEKFMMWLEEDISIDYYNIRQYTVDFAFAVLMSSPEQQALAIFEVLKELENATQNLK